MELQLGPSFLRGDSLIFLSCSAQWCCWKVSCYVFQFFDICLFKEAFPIFSIVKTQSRVMMWMKFWFFFVIKLELWISKFGNIFPSLFWAPSHVFQFLLPSLPPSLASLLSFQKPWFWIFDFLDLVVFHNVPSWFTFYEKTHLYLLVIFLIWTVNPHTQLPSWPLHVVIVKLGA